MSGIIWESEMEYPNQSHDYKIITTYFLHGAKGDVIDSFNTLSSARAEYRAITDRGGKAMITRETTVRIVATTREWVTGRL